MSLCSENQKNKLNAEGNNGRARKKRRLKALSVRVGFSCCVLVVAVGVSSLLFPHLKDSAIDEGVVGSSAARRKGSPSQLSITDIRPVPITKRTKRPVVAEAGILQHGNWHLINIHISPNSLQNSNYQDVNGMFCPLNWSLYKIDPSQVPFFKDLVESSGCTTEQSYSADLRRIVNKVRIADASNPKAHSMVPAGFIFHQSRCGSTLVSNVLSAVWPNTTRVYSESTPLIHAIKACEVIQLQLHNGTGVCHPEAVRELIRDVMYLLGRTANPLETNMYFKIQSMGIIPGLEMLTNMYPAVPWIFLYRHPIEVLMSYFRRNGSSVCTRGYQQVKRGLYVRNRGGSHDATVNLLERKLGKIDRKLSKEQYCAATLATYCEAALVQYKRRTGASGGRIVSYKGLQEALFQTVFLLDFGLNISTVEQREIANRVFGMYSKKRRKPISSTTWVNDSVQKHEIATEEVKNAYKDFLWAPYHELERLANGTDNEIQQVNGDVALQ